MKTRRSTNIAARRAGQRLKLGNKTDRRRCIVPSKLTGGCGMIWRRITRPTRVILHHIMVGIAVWKGDHGLSKFANLLMAKDPQQRPPLLESHVASVHK